MHLGHVSDLARPDDLADLARALLGNMLVANLRRDSILEAGPDGPMLRVARHRQTDKRRDEALAAVAAGRAQAVPIAAKTKASFLSATRAIWRLAVKEPKAASPCYRRRG